MDSGEDIGAMDTLRRGVAISPELREGLGVTLLLAVVASCGQVVVPIAVQQTLDQGMNGPDGPRLSYVVWLGVAAAVAIAVTSVASYLMTKRLFSTSERGLATLRTRAFRHVHDLPLLTQNTERRGALVSRVTTDVDQVSQFLVFGGLILRRVSVGQMLVATVLMLIYSCGARRGRVAGASRRCSPVDPLLPEEALRGLLRRSATRSACYSARSASPSSVPPSSAPYGVEDRTQRRIDTAIDDCKVACTHAQSSRSPSFSLGRPLGRAGQRRRDDRRCACSDFTTT